MRGRIEAPRALVDGIGAVAHPISDGPKTLQPIVDRIGDARFVLIGESTHGTAEFYRLRAQLTRRLVEEKGFCAIAAEADWPDAYRVNRFVRDADVGVRDPDARAALGDFRRFPQWMWRNREVLDALTQLRAHNERVPCEERVGFYGLDLYSLHASIDAVLRYLEPRDPEAFAAARAHYACFDRYGMGGDPHRYGQLAARLGADCEAEATAQLVQLRQRRADALANGLCTEDEGFAAEMNAKIVVQAAHYYRQMYRGEISTWNLRDTHMADTLDALATHLSRPGRPAKIVVWAHNSHCGDSAATQKDLRGELTLGHLCRQRHAAETVLVGFSTYGGTVTAASDWDEPAEQKRVRPGLANGYEALFHATQLSRFALILRAASGVTPAALAPLSAPRLQRAIGVVYRPDTERQSHYFHADLPRELDAIIHVDQTTALEPLDELDAWHGTAEPEEHDEPAAHGELPETFPSGL